jgi:riboflavin synthase
MFTGIIDDVGIIESVRVTDAGREMRVRSRYDSLTTGESIALNGACMTVYEFGTGWFTIAAITTSLGRTTMGSWGEGQRINLERALAFGDRLGGHMVQGHVDDVAAVRAVKQHGDARLIDIAVSDALSDLMVPHGSIAVDGVSLTVNELPAPGIVQLSLIEYTLRHTTLGDLVVGDRVHVEGDVIGKYIRKLTAPYLASRAPAGKIE